jgi:CheY-like chemotaxis protein
VASLGHLPGFQDLMRHRVQEILLVASLYDSFILEEDGQLNELLLSKFLDLNLRHAPQLTRVSTGAEALALARGEGRFDLMITTMQVGDMSALELARRVAEGGPPLPVILLAYDNRELNLLSGRPEVSYFDRVFLWQGDARILLAIVKYVEDKLNVDQDTAAAGVQVILLIEDSVRYYSSFLPMIDTELLHHSHQLISEGVNLPHKILRLRARPKILLSSTFEEAWGYFSTYQEHILGIISDIEFPREGEIDPFAGVEFARRVRDIWPDVPILLQSSRSSNEALARSVGASFLLKGSPVLLNDLRKFLVERLGFGDFVFRLPDGSEVGRARDLRSLEELLHTVPAESIAYHGERNHFSNWFKTRTEFSLAHKLRPRKVSDFSTLEDLRENLIQSIHEYRREQYLGTVADFEASSFDAASGFARIGRGSLGGKARGLAFIRRLLSESASGPPASGVRVVVPPAVVLATDVFDQFLEENDLRDFAINCSDDGALKRAFEAARFPAEAGRDLAAFLTLIAEPLAVRSSSLLEDSPYQPFAGVYETYMLSNSHPQPEKRLAQLIDAIKRVYASTFSARTKAHLKATTYRLEEEKMAVIVQKIVGARHQDRYYPDFAGVARSYNFYPIPPLTAEDGIVAVALGLGKAVIEGEPCLRFCPRYPRHLFQFSTVEDMLANSQREFWALELSPGSGVRGVAEARFGLEVAEADGTLAAVASTYSPENEAVSDGLSRPGIRLVSFAPILKQEVFPLAEMLDHLLELASAGTSGPVEIEFAANLATPPGTPREFGFLQMRPLVLSREMEELDLGEVDSSRVICKSSSVLGHGKIGDLHDAVVVDLQAFDRSKSQQAAREIAELNARLSEENRPYLLIGVGRWGSADPWLGIPVTWEQIAGARVIVEAGFKDHKVTPSQGSHFFQNLASNQVGYFTVNPDTGEGFIDWEWLRACPAARATSQVRHLFFQKPLVVCMDGRKNLGYVFKPQL